MSLKHRYPVALLVAAVLSLAGLAARSPGWLALAVLFTVYAASLLFSHLGIPRLRLEATRTPRWTRATEGEAVDVELHVSSQERGAWCTVIDELPRSASLVKGKSAVACHLPPGESAVLHYGYRSARGLQEQSLVTVHIWSPWGLAVEEHRFDCRTAVFAIPRVEPLPSIALRPRRIHAFVGPVHARSAGPGVEFFGCRAYVEGDDPRRINWRAFARYGRLFVNEYEQERMTDVVILLDVRAAAHLHVGATSTFEPACRAAASLATHSVRQGNRTGLLLYGRSLDWIQPAGGRFHLERILSALAVARLSASAAFDDLASLPIQMLPSGCQVIVVSPLSRDGDDLVLARLRARGLSVLSVLVDSLDLERAAQPRDTATDLAFRTLSLRASALQHSLEGQGVHVVRWDIQRPLAEALLAARADRAARRVR
ncbi:MAG: DUF58 domain-containing protein [Candidatus Bipolaricaulota bacterium]